MILHPPEAFAFHGDKKAQLCDCSRPVITDVNKSQMNLHLNSQHTGRWNLHHVTDMHLMTQIEKHGLHVQIDFKCHFYCILYKEQNHTGVIVFNGVLLLLIWDSGNSVITQINKLHMNILLMTSKNYSYAKYSPSCEHIPVQCTYTK